LLITAENEENMEWLQANWFDVVTAASFIISGASIITKFTKNTMDDKVVGKILSFLALVPKK
jgi:hypothetical protein